MDYFRCIRENKAVQAGYAFTIAGGASLALSFIADRPDVRSLFMTVIGLAALYIAKGGLETVRAYRWGLENLWDEEEVQQKFPRPTIPYCGFVGLSLAAEELGLEERLMGKRPSPF